MNIFHIYAQDYNVGDHLLGHGVQNMFLKWFDSKSLFRSFDIHSTIIDEQFIGRINQEADLLLVGGGGLIHGIDKWMLNIEDEMIDEIKKPIIIFGVGYNFFRTESGMTPVLKESIELMSKKALSFSVRNDGSHERLLDQGLYFKEIPDPGFFLDKTFTYNLKKNGENLKGEYVIIQMANDGRACRGFNDGFNAAMAGLIKEISPYHNVILIPHLEVDEWLNDEIYGLVKNLPNVFKLSWHDLICREHLQSVICLYGGARFVVGMRGHAQICPIGLNVPVITVATHDKIGGMAKKLGYEFLNVEIDDPNLEEELIKKAGFLMDDNNLIKIKKYNSDLMTDIKNAGEEFVKELKKKFDECKKN